MEAAEVISLARSTSVPNDWNVWPLQQRRVMRSAINWAIIGVIGAVLFVGAAIGTIPDNFGRSGIVAVFTVVLLALLATMGFGGLGLAIYDAWRLRHADEFLLVITPDDYVKQEPGKISHVPLEHIAYITLKGVKAPELREAERLQHDATQMHTFARIAGRFNVNRQPKSAPSLAFMDLRDESEVIVGKDNSFDDLYAIEDVLSYMVIARQRSRTA